MEQWKTIPEWDCYQVSDHGRIRRTHSREGHLYATPEIKDLTQPQSRYVTIVLKHRGRRKSVRIHTLVLEAFIGPRPEGLECRHLNGDARDNRLENLAWGTHKDNYADEVKHGIAGLTPGHYGVGTPSKLTADDIGIIHTMIANGIPQSRIAAHFGVCQALISNINRRKVWKHVSP